MKKFCLLLCIVLLLPIFYGPRTLAAEPTETADVKIGLFYSSNAQSQINISADKGVAFNAFDSQANKYYPAYKSGANEIVTIIKDSYFIKNGSGLIPVDPSNKPTIGPFHIQISEGCNTFEDTVALVKEYKEKGVTAYSVYTDKGWFIWTGFYINKAAGDKALSDIKTKLGDLPYTVIEQSDKRVYGVDKSGEVLFMYASEKNLLRGKSLSKEKANPILIGSTLYRGQVEFLRQSNSDMTIINVLPFEEYIYGVVPNEIEAYSHVEALKVQAIAARTYSYKTSNKHLSYGFNLCTTTDCQVYKGYSSEAASTNKAIDETKDMIVTYKGSPAETVFFASSGGQTEAAVNVWGNDIPYLQSVESKYESGNSYRYNWNLTYTIDEVNLKLKSYNLGTVTGIEITKYSEAGRPIELIVKGTLKPEGVVITKGRCQSFLSLYSQWYTMTTNADISINVNNQKINTQLSQVKVITAKGETTFSDPAQEVTILGANGASTTVSVSPTQYDFVGKGWGHAVGMSQEGAKGMANKGFTFDKILEHYYPGTKIELKK